ncbi:SMP-30/gluconolactonase/LRE family protein [uncultured Jatrophihabitans sp.]|uniref:SMP-30/gluconolactonase/LRE family protein n=1 Tax=uncultured Jatrophihabitans sp. TaxID=1610747 RepID=UPI0035CA160A
MTTSPAERSADHVIALGAEHAESPAWNPTAGTLSLVDTTGRRLLEVTGRGDVVTRHHHDSQLGAALPTADGGYLLCDEPGVAALDRVGHVRRLLQLNREGVRMNDAKIAPDGSLWAGSMSYDHSDKAALWRWDGAGSPTQLLTTRRVSNGLDWSADGRWLIYVDSTSPCIMRYPVLGETLGQGSVLATLDNGSIPDGLCVDSDGCVWLALYGAGQLRRYSPAGVLLSTVTVPVTQVTSCAFGGADLSTLYITTSRLDLKDAALAVQPTAGDLFAVATDTPGRPSRLWDGRTDGS